MSELETTRQLLYETALFSSKAVKKFGDTTIVIETGGKYEDKSDIILYVIERDGKFILTDKGRTRACMKEVFDLSAMDVVRNILALVNYYGISAANKQLSIEIAQSKDGFTEAFLRMMYCIGFLDDMRIFYE
jgi:hypothetical protein